MMFEHLIMCPCSNQGIFFSIPNAAILKDATTRRGVYEFDVMECDAAWNRTQRYAEKSKITRAKIEKKWPSREAAPCLGLKDGAGEIKETRQEVQPRDQRGRSVDVCATQSTETAQLFISGSAAQS
jgi:hypothetical protein